jgi:hypothetical protein
VRSRRPSSRPRPSPGSAGDPGEGRTGSRLDALGIVLEAADRTAVWVHGGPRAGRSDRSGCTRRRLRNWVRQAEIDGGARPVTTSDDAKRFAETCTRVAGSVVRPLSRSRIRSTSPGPAASSLFAGGCPEPKGGASSAPSPWPCGPFSPSSSSCSREHVIRNLGSRPFSSSSWPSAETKCRPRNAHRPAVVR